MGNRPPIPASIQLSPLASDFLENKTFAIKEADRPSAAEALRHPFLAVDDGWTWGRDSALARKVGISSAGGMGGGGARRRKAGEAA